MIIEREADRREDVAAQRLGGDGTSPLPDRSHRRAAERTVAGEAELAAGPALSAFEDDAADRVRIGRVADPVQHDLGDGALAVQRFHPGLVINGGGQAIERARPVNVTGASQAERAGGRVGTARHGNGGVDRLGALGGDLADLGRAHRLGALLKLGGGLHHRGGAPGRGDGDAAASLDKRERRREPQRRQRHANQHGDHPPRRARRRRLCLRRLGSGHKVAHSSPFQPECII